MWRGKWDTRTLKRWGHNIHIFHNPPSAHLPSTPTGFGLSSGNIRWHGHVHMYDQRNHQHHQAPTATFHHNIPSHLATSTPQPDFSHSLGVHHECCTFRLPSTSIQVSESSQRLFQTPYLISSQLPRTPSTCIQNRKNITHHSPLAPNHVLQIPPPPYPPTPRHNLRCHRLRPSRHQQPRYPEPVHGQLLLQRALELCPLCGLVQERRDPVSQLSLVVLWGCELAVL